MSIWNSKHNPFHRIHEWLDDTFNNEGPGIFAEIADPGQYDRSMWEAAMLRAKYIPPPKTAKMLSVTDIIFRESSRQAIYGSSSGANLLDETLDITSYPDRAILKLQNNRGFDVYLTTATLEGKRIMQYSGENGELIHDSLKRDDDIRRNGEKVFEIGNEFIVDATQCANIADYWYKFLGKKKHMYAVSIPGFAYWYEVGDWYNFQVGEADTNEYIDTTVEVYAVDVEKTAGGIGTTTLLLREVEESWAKSTLYATRLATGGSPKRRVNRSNIVTVASVDYDGTYDYKCDGTADEVQIQAAIDYIASTGGGEVWLTSGTYDIGNTVTIKSNVVLTGNGSNPILNINIPTTSKMIILGGENTSLKSVSISGTGYNMAAYNSSVVFSTDINTVIDNVQFYGFNKTSAGSLTYLVNGVEKNLNIRIYSNTFINMHLFVFCSNFSNIQIYNNTFNPDTRGFIFSNTMFGISVYSNHFTADSSAIYFFSNCQSISSCSVYSNTHDDYSLSFFYNCSGISSVTVRNNTSTASAPATDSMASFQSCNNMTACLSLSNTAITGAIGFVSCKSMQQCKSNDASPYVLSYADSGTANACADTAAGGYNS